MGAWLGRSAAVLHREGGADARTLWPLADVDADGMTDLVRERWELEGEAPGTATLVDADGFVDRWTRPASWWLTDAGDADGQPGAELLELTFDFRVDDHGEVSELSSTVRSLTGSTGAVRWELTPERRT